MKNFWKYTAIAAFAPVLAACSSDLEPAAESAKMVEYQVSTVITVPDVAFTRTALDETDTDRNLAWSWNDGDVVYCTSKEGIGRGTLVASNAKGSSATFSGTISLPEGKTSEALSFHYLGKNANLAGQGITYTFDLSKQDGLFESLTARDVLTSTDDVTVTITDNYALIPNFQLNHLTAVGHFAVELPGEQQITKITMTGNNVHNTASFALGSREVSDYGLLTGTAGIEITGENKNDFYVTLLPGENVPLHFDIVTVEGKTYGADVCYLDNGELSEDPIVLTILAGRYYRRLAAPNQSSGMLVQLTSGVEYTLTYDGNVKSGEVTGLPASVTEKDGATHSFTVSDLVPTWKINYTFGGWAEVAHPYSDDTIYKGGDTLNADKNNPAKILYAIWEQKRVNFYVDYNKNAGSDAVSGMPSGTGSNAPMGDDETTSTFKIAQEGFGETFAVPTRKGYKFLGWKAANTGTLYQSGDSYTLTAGKGVDRASVTFYAQWEEEHPTGGGGDIIGTDPLQ